MKFYTRILFLFLVAQMGWAGGAAAQNHFSAEGRHLLNKLKKEGAQFRFSEEEAGFYLLENRDGELQVNLLALVTDQADESRLQSLGVKVLRKIGSVWTMRVPVRRFTELTQAEGVSFFQIDQRIAPLLDSARVSARVDPVYAGQDLPKGYTGKGVLVGVIDGGFDYTHPTFLKPDGSACRIVRVWDQNWTAGTPPQGFDFGQEFKTPEAIANAMRDTIDGSHATHVAGIAAGSGYDFETEGQFRGVAPEADIVMVPNRFTWLNVLHGVDYVFQVADERQQPCVINISLGGFNGGTMDGTSTLDQGILNLTTAKPGRVVVTSAGNSGRTPMHYSKNFANDTIYTVMNIKDSLSFFSNPTGQTMGHGTIQGEVGKQFSFYLRVADNVNTTTQDLGWFHTADNVTLDTTLVMENGETMIIRLATYSAYPTNNRPSVRMYIDDNTKQKKRNVIWGVTAPEGIVHLWNVGPIQGTDLKNKLLSTGVLPGFVAGNAEYTIGEPASGNGNIAVAAHTTRVKYQNILGQNVTIGTEINGEIADFTSHGPTIDGRMRPHLSGPGHSVCSAISVFDSETSNNVVLRTTEFNNQTYRYGCYSGTSMSSPMVAGIVALMLERNPTLTFQEVVTILESTVYEDAFTGDLPDEGHILWGKGKVDAYAAIQATPEGPSVSRANESTLQFSVYPNPTNGRTRILTSTSGSFNVQIFNAMGQTVMQTTLQPAEEALRLQGLAPGVYTLRLEQNGLSATQKIVLW